MKHPIWLALVALCLCACSSPSTEQYTDDVFRMHLRLWPDHHNNFELRDELTSALTRHNGLFDEAWLCMEMETIDPEPHQRSASNMALAAEALRRVGVDVSVQGISLGHGDSFGQQSSAFDPVDWGAARGVYSEKCQSTHCPRQPEFLAYIEKTYETYARACQPRTVWIDDDLRITNHSPARMICCCFQWFTASAGVPISSFCLYFTSVKTIVLSFFAMISISPFKARKFRSKIS